MKNLFYLVKIWVVTILVSPILFFSLQGEARPNFEWIFLYDLGQLVLIAGLMGGFLSILTFIAMGYYLVLESYKRSNLFNKITLSSLGFLGTFLTFALTDKHSFTSFGSQMFLPLTYALILVSSVWIFYPNKTN